MDLTIYLIAISLALDCFAISICISSSKKEPLWGKYELPIFFGIFQFAMTLIGYYLGFLFKAYIENIDHWIAFILLLFIGLKMIKEANKGSCENIGKLSIRRMISLSIATSIDAFVVGLAFSMINGGIFFKSVIIGLVALILSIIGVSIGNKLKSFKIKYIEIIGGLVIISIGVKILASHLFQI